MSRPTLEPPAPKSTANIPAINPGMAGLANAIGLMVILALTVAISLLARSMWGAR